MMYETAAPFYWLYGNVVEWETKHILRIIDKGTFLFMGIPTYEDKRWTFHQYAENIKTAIKGIQNGLIRVENSMKGKFGIALYAAWTTDNDEWLYFRTHWLNEK